jgi:hypothetical protein
MLNIVTALYRFENLETIYNSILINEDITWHISKSNKREDIDLEFIKNDKRVRLYNVDCEDTDEVSKINYALSKINNGYFCILDDDTLLHENMYIKYKECEENNFKGMLIGEQINPDGRLRLIASPPKFNFIDTGNVLSHYECLKECKKPNFYLEGVNREDFLFWNSVYEFYDKKCAIWNNTISYYNKISKDDRWKKEINNKEVFKKINNLKNKQKL